MMPRTLRENGAAVSLTAINTLVVVTAALGLETKLMALSLALGGLYLLQRVLVGKRRRSGHWLVQYGAMAAYYLPVPLVFYAAKAVYSTSHIEEITHLLVVGVLCMFQLIVPVQEDVLLVTNMRAYSLRYRPRDGYKYLMWLVFLAGWVYLEFARIPGCKCNCRLWRRLYRLLQMGVHFLFASVSLFINSPESTLDCQTKAVADYMHYMKRKFRRPSTGSPFFDDDDDDDANSNSSLRLLDCCRYPFVQGGNGKWFTVKDLVQRHDLPNEDKDIWLSYTLCRLLARRYYGFHCAEEGDDKVRRFALAGLQGTTDGYKRAFTIVEVQLAFLHDYFFTTSLPIIESGFKYIDGAQKLMTAFTSINLMLFNSTILIAIATFMSWCALFETPMSLLVKNLLAFYWRPIHTAFRKLNDLPDGPLIMIRFRPNPNAQDVFDPFQAQTGGAYWRNKIGQYSILQDYNRCSPKKALVAWFHRIVLSQPSYRFIKHLPVEEEEVNMLELESMRKLVANTLHSTDDLPTNGTKSLEKNKKEINRARQNRDIADFDWLETCRQETHTDTILIWHIATCYCDMSLRHCDWQEGFPRLADTDTSHKVALALSGYCAYLVAFLPELLPENILTTKQVFQRVVQEAKGALGTTPMEEKEKYTKMRELLLPHQQQQQTTFHKGVDLGRQLEMLKHELCWKVMAEFWAETILYVTPSDNAEAHIEQLAKGGEFITHLWAMLSNAGILKRATGECHQPPASTTIEGPPTHQLTEALSSSIDEASTSSMSSPPIQISEPPTNEKGKQPQIMEDVY